MERRIDQRLPIEIQVTVHRPGGHTAAYLSHNWSRGGVFLRTSDTFEVGDKYQLSISIPGQHVPVLFPALVTRVQKEAQSLPPFPPGVSFYFGELPPPVAAHIGELAKNLIAGLDAASGAAGKVLLLVSGDKTQRSKHAMFFEKAGAEVATAEHHQEAVNLLAHRIKPSVIVLYVSYVKDEDIAFIDTAHKLLGKHKPHIVVVADLAEGRMESLHHHAALFVPGPVEPRRLMALMDAFIRQTPHATA